MECIIELVVVYLPLRDICSTLCANKPLLRIITRSYGVWVTLIKRDYPYCNIKSCILGSHSSTPPLNGNITHYKDHYGITFSCGIGLRLSVDTMQLSIGGRITFTTTIFNTTQNPLEIFTGHAKVGNYYEEGALLRCEWKQGCYKESRMATFSYSDSCCTGSYTTTRTIDPNSKAVFTARAKLVDLVCEHAYLLDAWQFDR